MMTVDETKKIPGWLWHGMVWVIITLVTGAASTIGMVGYAVWDHESRITIIEAHERDTEKTNARMEAKLDQLVSELSSLRREIDRGFSSKQP